MENEDNNGGRNWLSNPTPGGYGQNKQYQTIVRTVYLILGYSIFTNRTFVHSVVYDDNDVSQYTLVPWPDMAWQCQIMA